MDSKNGTSKTALEAQVDQLQQRVAELEQRVEQRTAELQHTQGLLQEIIDHAQAAIFVKDLHGRFTLVNQACAQALSRSKEQVIGKTDADMLAPHVAEQNQRNDQVVVATARPATSEETIPLADGTLRTYLSHKFPLYDAQGTLYAVGGIATDMTDQKRVEEDLRTFKLIMDTSPDGIGVAGLDGALIYANQSLQKMTGYGEALIGKSALSIYAEDQSHKAEIAFHHVVEYDSYQDQMTLRRADGQAMAVQVTSFMIRDSSGQPLAITGLVHDISDLQRAEQERASLQEQVIDAQRAALRELSTPLIPISDDVVIMPLIGTIDSTRAQQVMEVLLEGIASQQAEVAILDITGVHVVDTQVANALVRAAQAVRLLGAQVVLTGIQPRIAQTLVQLGIDLSSIVTRGTLQSGIAYALNRT